ncbi:MAG: hypothetical protein V9H69_27820 [Anaerolineae bacterium]|jgi:hypothetical protein
MPPGNAAQPAVGNGQDLLLLAELRHMLEDITVQTMRQAARRWGWTLKGTAKSDIIEQMVDYLSDRDRMAAAMLTLPQDELAVLTWFAALGQMAVSSKQLQAALAEGSGIRLAQKTIDAHLQSLAERCLIIRSEYSGIHLPGVYRQWLPKPAVPRLLYPTGDQLRQPEPMTIARVTQMAQRLLSMVTSELPPVTLAAKQIYRQSTDKSSLLDPRRPSLVAVETLARWGLVTPAEQQLARFLLEQLVNSRLCRLVPQNNAMVLAPVETSIDAWEQATMGERLLRLRQAYLTLSSLESESRLSSWSEWDITFIPGLDDGLAPANYWITDQSVIQHIQLVGIWLSKLLAGLPAGVWYSVEAFCRLIFQTQRDLIFSNSQGVSWKWIVQGEDLNVQRLDFEHWMKSYGRLVHAWLAGPASWLLFTQLGYTDNRLTALRQPTVLPVGVAEPAPPGSLRFMADGAIGLDNDWRVSELRKLLRWISVEVARDAKTTLLRLDAGAFRRALHAGQHAASVAEAFQGAGFPLSPAVSETLRLWQSRAGRYQVYEQMTVLEFNEDVLIEELRAIGRLSNADFYQPAPRCLIFPDAQIGPALIDELRRRGYTPQVLP